MKNKEFSYLVSRARKVSGNGFGIMANSSQCSFPSLISSEMISYSHCTTSLAHELNCIEIMLKNYFNCDGTVITDVQILGH